MNRATAFRGANEQAHPNGGCAMIDDHRGRSVVTVEVVAKVVEKSEAAAGPVWEAAGRRAVSALHGRFGGRSPQGSPAARAPDSADNLAPPHPPESRSPPAPDTHSTHQTRPVRAQSPTATTSFGSGVAWYVRRNATSICADTGPVTSSMSACRGLATKLMPNPSRL